MKTIVIISPAHPLRGGIASSTERLAQELQYFGYEVLIYSFSLQYPSIFFPGKTQYTSAAAPKDLSIKTLVNSVNPINWWKVGKMLQKLSPDVVLVRFWMPFFAPSLGTILRLARKNGHTKTLCIADNISPHEPRPGDNILTRFFINAVDAFIVMSRSVKEDIRRFASDSPVEYIPHPIYDNYGDIVSRLEALQKLNLSPDTNYLLFFGFIRDYKGLDLLLNAMADERIGRMNLKLIVAGEYYSNESHYEKIIETENIQERLELRTHYIPKETVKYYFCAADLVVQPYKSATQSGISQLAYHFEKPMVVTDVGGLSEIVEHGKVGYVVEVNPNAIADAIVDFFQNQKAKSMTQGVKENKKLFSWSNMVKAMERLYNS